jgi:molecular chaperone DnaJ
MSILTCSSPPPSSESGDGEKSDGFLKSVWHKLMDNKNRDCSKPSDSSKQDTAAEKKDDDGKKKS